MNYHTTLTIIRKDINQLLNKGNEAISAISLLEYINQLESKISEAEAKSTEKERSLDEHNWEKDFKLAEYNWKKEASLAKFIWDKDSSLEMFKSVIVAGQNSMRAALLMHSGAAVALLAFMGNLSVNSETATRVANFAGILPWYLGGLLLVVVAYGTTYLTQNYYFKEKEKAGNWYKIISCTLVIFSYLTFIVGSYLGNQALLREPTHITTSELKEAVDVLGSRDQSPGNYLR